MDMVKVSDLKGPDSYVRRRGLDQNHIARMKDAVGVKPNGDQPDWPFPPIVVWRKSDGSLQVIDGNHRVIVAREMKVEQIPVVYREMHDEREALMEQVRLNIAHGLPLDKDSRDVAIRSLVSGGLTNGDVALLFGLSLASVGRIVTGKQRTGETGKRSEVRKGKKKARKGKLSPSEEFYTSAHVLFQFFRKNQPAVLHRDVISKYQAVVAELEVLAGKLTEAFQAAAVPAAK